MTPATELATLHQQIDALRRQCDRDGQLLRAQLRATGRPTTGTEASTTDIGKRLVENRLQLIRLDQRATVLRGHVRRHESATRN